MGRTNWNSLEPQRMALGTCRDGDQAGAGPRPAGPAVGRPLRVRVTTAQGSFLPAGCSKRTWSNGTPHFSANFGPGLGGPAVLVHAHALGRAHLGLGLVRLGRRQALDAPGQLAGRVEAARSGRSDLQAVPDEAPDAFGELGGERAPGSGRGSPRSGSPASRVRVSLMPPPPCPGPAPGRPALLSGPRRPGRRRRRGPAPA